MCGCSDRNAQSTSRTELPSDALSLRVDDMTCGHCAGTITKAVESGLPGTHVHADPGTKIVSVTGSRDLNAIKSLISRAGYTPSDFART